MKLLNKLVLLTAVAVLGGSAADACPRRQERQARRTCVSPAPARVAPQYDTIPRPVVPVPAIPPQVVMPAAGVLTLPVRVVQGCANGICPTR